MTTQGVITRNVGARWYCFQVSVSAWTLSYFSGLTRLSYSYQRHMHNLVEMYHLWGCVCVCVCVNNWKTTPDICCLLGNYADWRNLGRVRMSRSHVKVKVKVIFRRVQGHSVRSRIVSFHLRWLHFSVASITVISYSLFCVFSVCDLWPLTSKPAGELLVMWPTVLSGLEFLKLFFLELGAYTGETGR